MSLTFIVIVLVICGAIAGAIAQSKDNNGGTGFALGFFLGIIGIIIVAVQPRGTPAGPAGTYSMKCARCNAVQNVPTGQPSF